MKKTLSTILMSLLCVIVSAQQNSQQNVRPLSFDEALMMAMGQNPQISASDYEEKAAVQERKAAFGLRLPKIDVAGAYVHLGKDIGINLNSLKTPAQGLFSTALTDLQAIGFTPSPELVGAANGLFSRDWKYNIIERDLATVGGTVTLPIYLGGKINAANRAAKINERTAIQKGEQMRDALVSELVERYYGLSLANYAVIVRRQVMDAVKDRLRDAKALEENGVIPRSERLFVEVAMAEAERDLMEAQLKSETTMSALSNTLNEQQNYIPISYMFILNRLPDLEYFKQSALERNPQLKQVELKRELAGEGVKAQRAEFMPQIVAMGAGSVYNYNVSNAIPRWVVGGGVKINLFDGLNKEHKLAAAKNTVRQVESLQVKAENDILLLVENLYNEMRNYAERMPSLEKSMEFAQEYLRVKNAAFREGMSTASDVTDAELNLAKTRIEKLQTAYNYDLALAKLLEAAGLSEDFITYSKSPQAEQIRFE